MKSFWTLAASSALLLAVACGGREDGARQNEEPTPAETAAPAEAPSAEAPAPDAPPPATDSAAESGRATSGTGAARPPARSAAPPASSSTSDRSSTAAPPAASSDAAPGAPARRAEEWREVTVPQGTALPLELETPLSSETAQVEMPVRARVRQAVIVDGVVAIPTGAMLTGVVTQVERAGRVKGRAQLAFTFNRLQADNVREDVSTALITYVAESTKGEDATKIGVGAVGGAIVGGILGGGGGAAKGAAIGGAAGTGVVLATRGEEVTLTKGSSLAASLAAPLTVRVPAR